MAQRLRSWVWMTKNLRFQSSVTQECTELLKESDSKETFLCTPAVLDISTKVMPPPTSSSSLENWELL